MYLCVGNGQGESYIYDALDGSLVTHLRPRKVRALQSGCCDAPTPEPQCSARLHILGAHPARAVIVQGSISSSREQCRLWCHRHTESCLLCLKSCSMALAAVRCA